MAKNSKDSRASIMSRANVSDINSAEARARRMRENQANLSASEKLKDNATVIVAVIAGIFTSIVKFTASAITGSSAMFSEGIHSMVDAINDSLLLIGIRRSKRPPDPTHPFGYGSEIYFYSLTVALVIFVLGGGYAIYEGIQNVRAGGHPIENPVINYIVLGIGIVLESFSLSVAIRTVNKARGDMHIMKYIRESKSPTNITVFLEDTAAVIGMVVALIGNILSTATGYYIIDAWASVIIGAIMACIALILLKETRSLAIGEGLTVEETKDIVWIAENDPAVIKCGRVLSLYIGPDDLLVTLDATFREDKGEDEILMAVDRIEDEIMSEYPQTTRVFIEPESLNQVYRQRRDRKLAFAAYEEEKQREDQLNAIKRERAQRDEERMEQIKERRAAQRANLARAYNRMYFPELVADSAANVEVPQRKKLFSEIPCIQGDRVILDRVIDTDAEAIYDLKNNPRVQRYLPAFLFENQRDDVHETIKLLYGDLFTSKDSLILAVRIKETGELAGLIELYGFRDSLHKISLGCRLREKFWNSGIATEAVTLMVGYLYGETDIEIITASAMVENVGSARALEKSDFIRTARSVEEDWGFPEPTIVDKWFC